VKRLLLIDDHPIMRRGLAQLLGSEPGLEVCGEAGSAAEGLQAVASLNPDLVVMDLTLPDKGGLELLKDMQAQFPGQLCLVLSMHHEDLYGERALRAGARGYVMKEAAAEHLVAAVRRVLAGGIYLSEAMASRMLEMVAGQRQRAAGIGSLSDRELEVLEMIGRGVATKNIAASLHISARTVEAHRAHLKEKLGLGDGPSLVRFAVQWVEQRQHG
jgi:DNA-binding NarL/FixJ family response regulator